MNNDLSGHKKIVKQSERLAADLNKLFYQNSDEKKLLVAKLNKILQGQTFHHAIDLGAGQDI